MENLFSVIPAGDGKIANLFYSVRALRLLILWKQDFQPVFQNMQSSAWPIACALFLWTRCLTSSAHCAFSSACPSASHVFCAFMICQLCAPCSLETCWSISNVFCACMEEDGATIQPKSFWLGRVCHLVYVMVAIPWKGFLDLWFADHAMQQSWDGYSLLYKPPRHSIKELFGRNYPHLASVN